MNPMFIGRVNAEGLTVEYPDAVLGRLARHLKTLAGKPVDVIVRTHRNTRTDPQNRFYFGVVVPLIAEECGYEKDEMHELLAMRFLRIEDDPVTGSPRRKRTPATDTKEFGEYLDACMRFAAELGVYIPAPGEVEP